MNKINLSYVITTRNKLPYLKEVMARLLANVQEDEEIIVTDGASTDGTVEYLKDLYQQGKIHQFISEPDRGESHGYNKGFLMARGELIKDLTDDDAFYFPAIQECKKFMLEHQEVDVMSGNQAEVDIENIKNINSLTILTDSEQNYHQWLKNGSVVSLHGLPFMIRKKSLAFTGLYSTDVVWPDFEYSLRITKLNVNIAWNTAMIAIRIENFQSNFRNLLRGKPRYLEDRSRILFFYDFRYRKTYYKEMIRGFLRPIKRAVYQLFGLATKGKSSAMVDKKDESLIVDAFAICDRLMEEYNSKNNSKIIFKI
jgi:glycosyltransferase involved in cell wall biosynthesis